MEIIRFKSTQEMYRKELLKLKPNTLRLKDIEDDRFIKLMNFENGNLNNLIIEIENNKTGESFGRSVTDVTSWEGWVIISFK